MDFSRFFSAQHPIQDIRQRRHGVHCLLQGICLRAHLHQQRFGTVMQIIAQPLQINAPAEARIILTCNQLHLQGKRKVCLLIRIFQRCQCSILVRVAEPVKEHNRSHHRIVDLCQEIGIFCHPVPVQIDHHL